MSNQPDYKQRGYQLPAVIDPENCTCVCVPLPDDQNHIRAFLGQLDMLGYWWTWERDELKRGKDAAAVWRGIAECVRARLDNNCGCGGGTGSQPLIRFTEDGTLEASYDGGVTWNPAPELDPRLTSNQFPPIAGNDGEEKRCNAAWAAAAVIQDDIVATLASADAGIALVTVVAGVLAIYLSGGALAPLVTALVGAALQAGSSAITAAFTPEVWEEFRCILYCNMSDNAEISPAQVQQIKSAIETSFTGIVTNILKGVVDNLGSVGMTNAARSNRATGTGCDLCECDETFCYWFKFTTAGDEDWTAVSRGADPFGTYVSTVGWQGTDAVDTISSPDIASRRVWIERTFAARTITRIDVEYDLTKGNIDLTNASAFAIITNTGQLINRQFLQLGNGNNLHIIWTGAQAGVTSIQVTLGASRDTSAPYTYGGSAIIKSITVEGLDSNPFGSDNCE